MTEWDTSVQAAGMAQPGASFGAWVRLRRRALDLTQAALAARADISRSYLRKIETDQRRPSPEVAALLAAELAIPAAQREQFLAAARGKGLVAALHSPSSVQGERAAADLDLPPPPKPASPFLGRTAVLQTLLTLLNDPQSRLLTLVGPGGIGKTRLALELARRKAADFPDGVCFVPLADIRDPKLVMPAIARRLGLSEQGSYSTESAVSAALRTRTLLLVLDNMEQVVDAAPDFSPLLSSAPSLKIIVTSREVLRVRGEQLYWVPPLDLPDLDAPLETVEVTESLRFFLSHAQRARPDLDLDDRNRALAAAICRRLDGLPLALELAAARTRHLSLHEILARLESRMPILTGGPRDAPSRQRTLEATLDWSYELLSQDQQRLFANLGVFRGGFDADAAEALDGNGEVLENLASLVDKSLVRRDMRGQDSRFFQFSTISEFGLLKLQATGRTDDVRERHAQYFLALAESAAPRLHTAEQVRWLGKLESDLANFRSVLEWFIYHVRADEALRLVAALGWYWTFRGHVYEGFQWLQRALALEGEASAHVRASAINNAGGRLMRDADVAESGRALTAEALALSIAGGDRINEAWARAWTALYSVQVTRDQDVREIRHALRQANAIFTAEAHAFGMAWSLTALGIAAMRLGELQEGLRLQQESVAAYLALGSAWGIRQAHTNLGLAYYELGDLDSARASLLRALEFNRDLEDLEGEANICCALALVLARYGRSVEALTILSALRSQLTAHNTWFGYPEGVYFEELLEDLRRDLPAADIESALKAGLSLTRPVIRELATALY